MEKKTYFSPIMKIHTLALHCVMETGMSGGGTGTENETETDAKSSYNSFLDWDDNIEE